MTSRVKIIEDFDTVMKNYDPTKNVSRNVMTRFEKAKIIGMRLEQLARGALSTIDTTGYTNIRDICLQELKEKKIPFVIMRPLPNNNKEYWRISDLIIL